MLSVVSSQVANVLQSLQSGLVGASASPSLKVIAFCVSWLLGWRLWRFTIRPYMEPQAPKELPYWIPFLGHSLAFFSNSHALLERGLNYTKRTHEIYTIKVWGQKLYIITGPEDVAAAFRNNTSLNFDGHLNELLVNFGFKGEALRLAWHVAQPGESCYLPDDLITPRQDSLNRFTEEVYRQQLLPGPKMDVMCKTFIDSISNTLRWENLEFCMLAKTDKNQRVSLRALCQQTMVEAATRSMFGSHLHQIEPDVVQHMLQFNKHVWMIFFRYPDTFGSPALEPQRKLVEVLETFVKLPEESRPEQSWSIKTILTAQKIVGIDIRSRASVLLLIYWAANSNEYNISFWVISHLLFEESLLRLVKAETEAAWSNGDLDIKYLCSHSPNLDAIFCEALRLNGGAMVSRKVLAPTEIGGKSLKTGNSIIIPSRQLHTNTDVWGSDVKEFNAFRFANKKSLTRHSSFRPFGGGITYCPGRVLAKEEVFGFVAIILHRFNIKLADNEKQKFPRLDESKPALGIAGPVESTDVIVNISLAGSSNLPADCRKDI